MKKLPLSVAPESFIYDDAAYTDYGIEDDMLEAEGIHLKISRKSNSITCNYDIILLMVVNAQPHLSFRRNL